MKTRILFLLGMILVGLNSCEDAVPTVELEDFMYLFLNGAKSTPGVKKLNMASSRDTIFNVSMAYGGTTNYERGDIEGTIEADMSLVAAYNAKNASNYLPLPEAAFAFDKNKALIPNGKNLSETLKLAVKINKINFVYGYILPITIKSVNGGSLPVSDEYKTLYLIFEGDIDADLNQQQWVSGGASSTGQAGFEVGKALDDDPYTYWHTGTGLPQWMIVDMAGFKRIDGFTIYNRRDPGHDALPKHIKFETSLNKIDWQTVLDIAELPPLRTGQALPLEQPVAARYFKVTVLSSWSDEPYTYLADVGIYSGQVPVLEQDLEKNKWKVFDYSSFFVIYDASYTFDDDVNTYWHSDITGLPQWYSIDMQKTLTVRGFTYANRLDDEIARPMKVRFEVSTDGETWQTALVVNKMPSITGPQKFPLANKIQARYFKVTVETNWYDDNPTVPGIPVVPWTYVAETGIY